MDLLLLRIVFCYIEILRIYKAVKNRRLYRLRYAYISDFTAFIREKGLVSIETSIYKLISTSSKNSLFSEVSVLLYTELRRLIINIA